ncbi:uncharacterized protein LOC119553804 [Drosophila subpulchrella]|uniref:uncharacterized protein LOC119553804 n=1 Tax=Drosophila subpulchrella TaxID=1486046 RepID=UPI0018A16558|nr:uncharacterized protein LOC119553804 [Drosophila subpulchrella]
MNYKPIGPRKVKRRKEVKKSKPYESYYMYDVFKNHMAHLRFSHVVFQRKVPLIKRLQLVLEKNVGPHAHVVVGNTVYKCQVLILRIYCRLFSNNLKRGDLVRFPNGVMNNECFEMAYGWMITDQIYCHRSQLLDLLVATDLLKCAPLARSLFQRLDDHRHFSDLKAFACFWEAKRRGIKAMADMMLARAGKAFLALVCTKGFLRMDVYSLCDLLRSDGLAVQSEIEVFYAALLWLESNYQRRKIYIFRVMCLVRFHMMPNAFLLRFGNNLKNLRPHLADQICTLIFHGILDKRERRMNHRMSNSNRWRTRTWIRDPLCPYGIYLKRNGCCDINIEVFLYYLKCIRKSPDAFLARIRQTSPHEVYSKKRKDLIHEPSTSVYSGSKSPVYVSKHNYFYDDSESSDSDAVYDPDSESAETSTLTASKEFKCEEEDDFMSSPGFIGIDTDEEGIFNNNSNVGFKGDLKSVFFSDSSMETSDEFSTDTTEESSTDSCQEISANYKKPYRNSVLDSVGYVLADSETDSAAHARTDSETDSTRYARTDSETDSARYAGTNSETDSARYIRSDSETDSAGLSARYSIAHYYTDSRKGFPIKSSTGNRSSKTTLTTDSLEYF